MIKASMYKFCKSTISNMDENEIIYTLLNQSPKHIESTPLKLTLLETASSYPSNVKKSNLGFKNKEFKNSKYVEFDVIDENKKYSKEDEQRIFADPTN
jgi:hypothetical protein